MLSAIETRYRVIPIGTTERRRFGRRACCCMAHPLAQPAEALVDLDRWVRGGGDCSCLQIRSSNGRASGALGDKLRPPRSFADTGLLAHWGLRLEAPDHGGPAQRELDGPNPRCVAGKTFRAHARLDEAGFVARCRIGKGKAIVVADADFLNLEDLEGPTEGNNRCAASPSSRNWNAESPVT